MSTFLKAEWRKLVLINYEVDPQTLQPFVPLHTELDLWNNRCYVSLVGFMFLNTRVLGLKIPFHTHFEEVNLRFYVRHFAENEVMRGVVFIKEIVPKPALTFVANTVYGEHYATMPMRHLWSKNAQGQTVEYAWHQNQWHSIKVEADLNAQPMPEGSEVEFIAEHYWGYTRLSPQKTSAYQVTHPRWEVYPVRSFDVNVNFETVYGRAFAFLNKQQPHSVFLAEGSEIEVLSGKKL